MRKTDVLIVVPDDKFCWTVQMSDAGWVPFRSQSQGASELKIIERRLILLRFDYVDSLLLNELFSKKTRLPGETLRPVS